MGAAVKGAVHSFSPFLPQFCRQVAPPAGCSLSVKCLYFSRYLNVSGCLDWTIRKILLYNCWQFDWSENYRVHKFLWIILFPLFGQILRFGLKFQQNTNWSNDAYPAFYSPYRPFRSSVFQKERRGMKGEKDAAVCGYRNNLCWNVCEDSETSGFVELLKTKRTVNTLNIYHTDFWVALKSKIFSCTNWIFSCGH